MEEFAVGSIFAGHRIDGLAGRGGMGLVYRVTHIRLQQQRALKVIAPELSDDEDFRRRFERESRLAASIDHPHVIPIYDAGEDSGRLYITMRYVEGTDLRSEIDRRGRLTLQFTAHVLAQVGSALDAAHECGLVHRDVKPENILLTKSQASPQAYLTDFGLTKLTSSDSSVTASGMFVGTLDYIAPEQLEGRRTLDARADVYALGCVLYHALTGSVPYPRDTQLAKMFAHASTPAPRPSAAVPSLPRAVDDVVGRAMAKSPDERYSSAGSFGEALSAAAAKTDTTSHDDAAGASAAPTRARQLGQESRHAAPPPQRPTGPPEGNVRSTPENGPRHEGSWIKPASPPPRAPPAQRLKGASVVWSRPARRKVAAVVSVSLAAIAVGLLAVTGVFSSNNGGGAASRGGTVTMLTNGDVDDKLDPGYSYYQLDFIYTNSTQRAVLGNKPDDTTKASPDFAASYPTISKDGKTVTVKLKSGVKFSPPVNREATSADVKYAIERDFLPQVGNGYASAYWADLEGLAAYTSGKAKEISGLTTPDKYTLVMQLKRPTAAVAIAAMALPGSAPVPKEYAEKFDKAKQSTYGQHVVGTGPYMVQNDPRTGKITGYKPNRQITFVRNPNWDKSTDYRPAYLDKFVFDEGNDPTVGNRKVIDGKALIGNPADLAPPPAFLKQNLSRKDNVIPGAYSGHVRYVAMNTKKKPFDDPNVRKAVGAALDREAMGLAFGGKPAGSVATHILTPDEIGFEVAGGFAGPGYDWLKSPTGDMALAQSYLKKAGFKSGKYSGPSITMVADNRENQKAAAERVLGAFQKLGFKVNFRPVTPETMYSKFCSVPKSEPEVCPSVGWLKDFPDPQSILDLTFNGRTIIPSNNANWAQLDDPKINQAIAEAEVLTTATARAKAWAEIDKMVTGTAVVIPWRWVKPPLIKSSDVKAVINKANATWDMSYTSVGD
jgi:peptide/nickel transport system substrate-binding protein